MLAASSYVIAPAQAATVWDAATDFSATNNPTGVWSYGYTNTLGGTFNLYPDTTVITGGIDYWLDESIQASGVPAVAHNGTTNTVTYYTLKLKPGQLAFHPGPKGEYSVVRWKAPVSGSFNLTSSFSGADFVGPTSTDVHVLKNGTSLFNALVNGFGSPSKKSFSTSLLLNAGDLIDFTVGVGSNGTFFADTTGLSVKITTAVPEPSSILGILSLGALGIGLALKRKS